MIWAITLRALRGVRGREAFLSTLWPGMWVTVTAQPAMQNAPEEELGEPAAGSSFSSLSLACAPLMQVIYSGNN